MKHVSDSMHVVPPDTAPDKRLHFKLAIGEQIYELDVKNKDFQVVTGILNPHTRKRTITPNEGCWYCKAKSPDEANATFVRMAIDTLKPKKE